MNRKQFPIHLRPHPPTHPAEANITPEPEPLWRRVKTIERVLNLLGVLPPDQVDDAGRLCRGSPMSTFAVRCKSASHLLAFSFSLR